MISFVDGPAQGVVLDLRRAPFMLRVVRNRAGNWDALDQPDDEAKTGESITVYRLMAPAGWVHFRCQKRSQSGYRATGTYAVLPEQPAEEHVRTTAAWKAWCDGHHGALVAGTWAEGRTFAP